MPRHKWSQKEIREIFSKPFHCFPPPQRPGVERGPTEAFWPVFINDPLMRRKLAKKGTPLLNNHKKIIDLLWGAAGCHAIDTPILMFDGSIKMVQDIVVGDLLMGPDSQPRTVLSLCRGKDQMYKVIPVKGDPFIVNKNHILSLKTSGFTEPNGKRGGCSVTGTIKNISIKEYISLSKSDKNCLKLYKSEDLVFPSNVKLDLDPYWLGTWLGDGTSRTTQIHTMNEEIREYWQKVAENDNLILSEVGSYTSGKAKLYSIHGETKEWGENTILEGLQKLNLINNKHIPKTYLTASKENRLQLLAGLIDTDGHYSKGYYEITQKSKRLAQDIVFLCRSLGLGCYIKEVQKSCTYKGEKRTGTYYRVNVLGNLERIPCKLHYKKAAPRKQIKNVLVNGFKLEKLEVDNYYGFNLDKDHLYIMGDFTVTHNSGKTVTAVGLGLFYAITYPGSVGLVGAKVFDDIKDNVIPIYKKLLSINEEWDHPLVVRHPSGSSNGNKELVLKVPLADGGFAYSTIKFMHFKDWERLRGRSPDWIHFEEMSQMDDVSVLDELDRRCRGTVLPIRHVFCTTNPPKDFSHFIYEKWGVRQFQDGYDGPKIPMGSPCTCQFCQDCLNANLGEFEFDSNDTCTNPNCATIKFTGERGKRDYYKIGDETLCCKGGEEFWRAFLFKMSDNPHLPLDQQQSNKAGTDQKNYALFSEGKVIELDDDYCYPRFTQANVNPFNKELEDKDIILACDANTRPQMSAVIQEDYEELDGNIVLKRIDILDNIVVHNTKRPNPLRPGAGPADVALEFMERYPLADTPTKKGYPFLKDRTIWLWGDPNAHGNTQDPFQPTFYQIVYDMLTEAGYRVEMGIKSAKGNNKHSVIDRVTNVNWLLEDPYGNRKLFVNPKAEETIMSLQENKWDDSGKALKNKKPDKLNFKAKTIVKRPLTHITDAIDAYIAYKFNIIQSENITIFSIPGENSMIIRNGKVIKETPVEKLKKVLTEPGVSRQQSLKELVDAQIASYEENSTYNNDFMSFYL